MYYQLLLQMSLMISSHWRVICTQKYWCPTGNDLCPQGAPPWRRPGAASGINGEYYRENILKLTCMNGVNRKSDSGTILERAMLENMSRAIFM